MTHKTPNKKSQEPKPKIPAQFWLLPSIYLPASFPLALTGAGRHFPQLDAGQWSSTKSPPRRTTNSALPRVQELGNSQPRAQPPRLALPGPAPPLTARPRPTPPHLGPALFGPVPPGPSPIPLRSRSAAFPTLPQGVKSRRRGGVCCASPVRPAGRRAEASAARSGLWDRCVRRAPSRKRKPGGRAKGGPESAAVNSIYRTAWLSPVLAFLRLREMVRSGSRPGQVRAADLRRPFWGWKGTEGVLGW